MNRPAPSIAALRLLRAAGASALLFAAMAGVGRADLIINAPDVIALQGSTGSFDITIFNANPPGGNFDVSGDTIELILTGSPGVTFTDATISTTFPYVFVESGTTQPGGLPLSLDAFPNSGFLASDAEFAAPGFRAIGPGETYGLVHVTYAVDQGANLGTGSLSFGAGTSLSDVTGAPISFRTTGGTFTVTSPSVPEPASLALLSLGGLAVLARRIRRHRRPA